MTFQQVIRYRQYDLVFREFVFAIGASVFTVGRKEIASTRTIDRCMIHKPFLSQISTVSTNNAPINVILQMRPEEEAKFVVNDRRFL